MLYGTPQQAAHQLSVALLNPCHVNVMTKPQGLVHPLVILMVI
jgi:hypothetical protein